MHTGSGLCCWVAFVAICVQARLGAAQQSDGCALSALQSALASVQSACCGQPEQANGGLCTDDRPFPRECGWACATPFSSFWESCGGFLTASGVQGVEGYASFARTCQGTLRAGEATFNAGQLALIQSMIEAAVNASEAALLEEGGPVSAKCSVGAEAAASNAASMDNAWLVLGGALVFFMHSGFALLEVGSVSQRNVQNILFKNAVSPTFAALLFWAFGYTFAFGGNGEGGFIGSRDGWFLATSNMFEPSGAGMPYNSKEYAAWFFQWAFAATASTIVSGAVAERVNFQLYMIITVFLTGFIYPVVVHWQWGGGWSGAWGVLDFAGCGVVHMCGGVAALVATIFVGPRHGRFVTQYEHPAGSHRWYCKAEELPLPKQFRTGWVSIEFGSTWTGNVEAVKGQVWAKLPNKELRPDKVEEETAIVKQLESMAGTSGTSVRRFANILPASSPAFQTLGCFILWFGWYGFNCASTLGISGDFGGQAAKVAVTTTLGAAAGALSSGLLSRVSTGMNDLGAMANGILAGLVGITASCALIEPWAAVVIGAIAGMIFWASSMLVEAKEIDDVVLAIPVHLFCGMWGCIAVGLFTSPLNADAAFSADTCGIFYGCENGWSQLYKQCVFVIAVFVWTAATVSVVILGAGWAGVPMAYDVETQILGMDIKHDIGVTVKRVRSTKFPFFKESTVFSSSPSESDLGSPDHGHTPNPVSDGRAAVATEGGHATV